MDEKPPSVARSATAASAMPSSSGMKPLVARAAASKRCCLEEGLILARSPHGCAPTLRERDDRVDAEAQQDQTREASDNRKWHPARDRAASKHPDHRDDCETSRRAHEHRDPVPVVRRQVGYEHLGDIAEL